MDCSQIFSCYFKYLTQKRSKFCVALILCIYRHLLTYVSKSWWQTVRIPADAITRTERYLLLPSVLSDRNISQKFKVSFVFPFSKQVVLRTYSLLSNQTFGSFPLCIGLLLPRQIKHSVQMRWKKIRHGNIIIQYLSFFPIGKNSHFVGNGKFFSGKWGNMVPTAR